MNEPKENQKHAGVSATSESEHVEEQVGREKKSTPTETVKPAAACECSQGCVGLPCCT